MQVTVMHSMQAGYLEKAQKYTDKALMQLEKLKSESGLNGTLMHCNIFYNYYKWELDRFTFRMDLYCLLKEYIFVTLLGSAPESVVLCIMPGFI